MTSAVDTALKPGESLDRLRLRAGPEDLRLRDYLEVPYEAEAARIVGCGESLPVAWRYPGKTAFELPRFFRQSEELRREVILRVDTGRGEEQEIRLRSEDLLAQQPFDSHPGMGQDLPVGEAEAEPLSFEEKLIVEHLEAFARITFPTDQESGSPVWAEGCCVSTLDEFEARFWEDPEEAPLHLIVLIAQACLELLEDLCQRPRKLLRSRRELQRIEEVQRQDEACIRWLASRPGKTIAQKAGPRQRAGSCLPPPRAGRSSWAPSGPG